MFCRQCGNELNAEALFCRRCGTAVGSKASAAASRATVAAPPPAAAVRAPASRSSSAPAVVPAPAPEVPRPIGVASVGPPKSQGRQERSDQISASPKSTSWLPWGSGISVVLLVAAVIAILYLRYSQQATLPDAQIEKSIQARFAADPDLNKYAITVHAQKGVVTLVGSVRSSSDRSTAARLVLQQSGVKTLVDDLILTRMAGAPKLAGAPSIASVTPIMPQATQDILIRGIGFGSQPAYEGDLPFLILEDVNKNWRAGCRGRPECGPGDNTITLRVSSWTDSEIHVEGLGGRYAVNPSFRLEPGDEVKLWVWNTQTGTGPATYNVTVGNR